MSTRPFFAFVPFSGLSLGLLSLAPTYAGGTSGLTDRVSRYTDGSQSNLTSVNPAVSADGFIVAFETREPLVAGDLNGVEDIYVIDRRTGEVRCASRSFQNKFGNGPSRRPALSQDGRFVAFHTEATNLAGILDQNAAEDVVVKDMVLNTTKLISGANLSLVSANGASRLPAISANGRFVAFQSLATNMIPGDTNGEMDIYVRDLELDSMFRASVGYLGEGNGPSYAPSISNDGQRVAFHTEATNLTTYVDNNAAADVLVHFTDFTSCLLVSKPVSGGLADSDSFNASISSDGQRVAFTSRAENLFPGDNNGVEDVFYSEVYPPLAGARLISAGSGGEIGSDVSHNAKISGDGQSVVFQSLADNLTSVSLPFSAIFQRDIGSGSTYLVSRPTGDLHLPNDLSRTPAANEDGSIVVFASEATNLDQGDTNGLADIFVRHVFAVPEIYCEAKVTSAGCLPSIGYQGESSASKNSGFVVSVANVPNQKPGMLFYGLSGRNDAPFYGGLLCVKNVVGRSPVLFSGGTPPPAKDCSGSMQIDMNAFANGSLGGNPHANLSLLGQRVNVQFWGRDPGAMPDPVFLSDALEYVVGL